MDHFLRDPQMARRIGPAAPVPVNFARKMVDEIVGLYENLLRGKGLKL